MVFWKDWLYLFFMYFVFPPKDLRESYSTQQLALEQLHRIKQDKIREVEKRRAELAQKKRLEDEAARYRV